MNSAISSTPESVRGASPGIDAKPTPTTSMPHHRIPTNVTLANSLPRYSRAKPLAASLGLSSRTLFRYAQAGHFARFRLNSRTTLFDVGEVTDFVKSGRVTPLS